MKVLDPGHVYLLDTLDGEALVSLRFVKREGPGYPGNFGHYPGTNIQEVLRALIDRMKYLNEQIPDKRNESVMVYLRNALFTLELRAAERHGRGIENFTFPLEEMPACTKCGHIGCQGACH